MEIFSASRRPSTWVLLFDHSDWTGGARSGLAAASSANSAMLANGVDSIWSEPCPALFNGVPGSWMNRSTAALNPGGWVAMREVTSEHETKVASGNPDDFDVV